MELRYNMDDGSYLMHYGVPGMKWGIRHDRKHNNSDKVSKNRLSDRQKTAIKIGAALVGTALIAYGGYKLGRTAKVATNVYKETKRGKELAERLLAEDRERLKEGLKKYATAKPDGKTTRRAMALSDPMIKVYINDADKARSYLKSTKTRRQVASQVKSRTLKELRSQQRQSKFNKDLRKQMERNLRVNGINPAKFDAAHKLFRKG